MKTPILSLMILGLLLSLNSCEQVREERKEHQQEKTANRAAEESAEKDAAPSNSVNK